MSGFRRLASPAGLIAVLALVVSLSGTAYAALVVTGAQVKNGSLTGLDIKNGSVTGKDVKNDSLTGADIREGTLAKVKAATAADSLAGGVVVRRIRMIGTAPMDQRVILTLRSLTLRASCALGDVIVTASTTSADAEISWIKQDANGGSADNLSIDDNFQVGDTFTLDDTDHSDSVGTLRYVASNGDVVNVDITEEDGFLSAGNCVVTGYAIG